MSKIMRNNIIDDMTPEEQARFDKDQASPPVIEDEVSAEELLARLEALLK